ncbi:MAG: PorP/SprF family type IX secretion system membrane protein [Owenweeksia sp.]
MEQLPLSVKRITLFLGLLFGWLPGRAQDPTTTQFHITRNYLNPAYAGYSSDLSLNYNSRLQWTKVSGKFSTHNFAANIACEERNLGFALYGYDNVEGDGLLRTTLGGFQTAIYFPWNLGNSNMVGSPGMFAFGFQVGIGQQSIDWDRLVFTDQLSDQSYRLVRPTSIILPQAVQGSAVWDIAAGFRGLHALFDEKGYISFGASAFHLARNQKSFFGNNSQVEWPIRYTGHLWGHYFWENGGIRKTIELGSVFNSQVNLQTITTMLYYGYDPIRFGGGLRAGWVESLSDDKRRIREDAWVAQVDFKVSDNFLLSYTFEYTRNEVGIQRTFGTHEIGLTYIFEGSVLCPELYKNDIDCINPIPEIQESGISGL